ncbi:MAG: response regulator transcription factor [Paludibacteraceae bacterium]|nr:response regulator transcription factor [Paludibacteraceae bacterium]MBR4839962.1 response regulator transcription factor [Paludibacteraceae bacterium]
MEDAGKILVVDDEQDLCEILQFNLETDGYVVDTANSAEEALKLTLTDYSLILLDVMMGDVSGFQMAERLKSHPSTSDIPIIFITALDNEECTLRGFNIGADDYMAKPLSMREVKARVRAVLRRNHRLNQTSEGEKEGRNALLRVDELTLDRQAKSVRIGNVPVDLTKLEFELLLVFLQNQGHLFSREELLAKVWPSEAFVTDRTVDVNITRLRKKIGRYGKCVKTKVGYGYYFENALR